MRIYNNIVVYMGFPGGSAVKNPPAMQETWVWSLGWEDLQEEGMATQSSILAWRIPMDRGDWGATVHGVAKSRTWLSMHIFHLFYLLSSYPCLGSLWPWSKSNWINAIPSEVPCELYKLQFTSVCLEKIRPHRFYWTKPVAQLYP